MLLGNKGVKYGLQLPAKPATKQVKKPQAAICIPGRLRR